MELAFELFCDWYEVTHPSLRAFYGFHESQFQQIWTYKWFAKRENQIRMDAYLKKYESLFSLPEETSTELPREQKLLFDIAYIILWDQVSRNIFRNSALAYATDKQARERVEAVMPFWKSLPFPIQITCLLVYIHSEDKADLEIVERLLKDLEPSFRNFPSIEKALKGIATNHRDRMNLFGRIPERNRFLGRPTTEAEAIYLSMF